MGIKYPTRCEIIDVTGMKYPFKTDIILNTPDISKPHVGKRGIAERDKEHGIRITLDDGTIIYGYDCWWIPVNDDDA